MNRRFKKRLKPRKTTIFIFKLILIFFLILFMQNNKIIKQFINNKADNYINNTYEPKHELLSMKVESNIKNNDNLFAIKEEKNHEPLIYIYNTHQNEKYLSSGISYTPSVMYASKYLSEKLNENNLPSIVESRSINEVLSQNGWAYGASYKVSRRFMEDTFENNNSIKYFLDIHRDAGSHKYTTLCIDNKCYAKILFIVGLENPTYHENQLFAEELNKELNNKLNGLSKGILQKQGKKVNGVYNQDFSPRAILIEVGGENNSIDEVYNTLNILSEVLADYINKEITNGN